MLKFADPISPNILTIGFARRFATYKRATLIFEDLDRLREIILNQEHPVLLIFAGKAHPVDVPGQDLIRQVSEFTRLPEFEGRVLLVEGYDLRLARRLVSGVDVWLNNPVYPLEASGTSGMKAGINGAINLSVLDGWWGEGYDGKNGWAIKPGPEDMDTTLRDKQESRTLYEILQDQVIPLYYSHDKLGYSPEWVKMVKHSMATLLPRYNATRMVGEYVNNFYLPASKKGALYIENNFDNAKKIASWKTKVRSAWSGVAIKRLDKPCKRISFGDTLNFKVAAKLNGLDPDDVVVELMICRRVKHPQPCDFQHYSFQTSGTEKSGEHFFELNLAPNLCGKLECHIRMYPCHPLLTHQLEMGMMLWL
jgi:starch phosphorylase